MNHKIKISIPKPCHENWLQMSSSEKGRFCSNCQKEVIDFTKSSDREIFLAYNKSENLCGQFRVTQLDRDISIPKEKKSIWIIAAASIIAFLGLGNQTATAQGNIRIEQTDKENLNNQEIKEEIKTNIVKTYKGILYDENKIPLPGASIFIKGTDIQNQTNFNGEFSVQAKKGDILVFSYIGYNNIEFKIRNKQNISIAMKKSDIELLGEVLIIKSED